MKGNNGHITDEFAEGKEYLPLNDFYINLKQNGFLVTPKQVVDSNMLIQHYSAIVKNDHELCNYLSPIFANNQDEQIQFKQIFEQYFDPSHKDKDVFIKPTFWQKLIRHLKKHWWKYVLSIALVIATLIYFLRRPTLSSRPAISITASVAGTNLDKEITTQNKRLVKAVLHIKNAVSDSTNNIKLKTKYNWGDNTNADKISYHTYHSEGIFTITAYADVWYRGYRQYTDTINTTIAICFRDDSIHIAPLAENDSVRVGREVALKAIVKSKMPFKVQWTDFAGNSTVKFRPAETTAFYTFSKEGQQTIYCTAVSDSANSPCSARDSISFFVYDPKPKPQILFSASQNAKTIRPKYKVKQWWFYTLGLLTLASLFLTSFFALKWNRTKKNTKEEDDAIQQEYQNLLQSFTGKSGPAVLPFSNKNYLPLPEEQLSEVARQMRRRISDDTTYLNVEKTIYKAINNAGFFSPVKAYRTQQSEYLVLIDENHLNSQQVKLFDYLLELFSKQNVFITKYYYRTEPKSCYNTEEPGGISLEKLSEKYPRHVLLIFGDAYQLIYQLYPVIDSSYLRIINHWQYKAVLTPVSFLDWGNKEKKILLEELPVFPVDIPGQLLLMQKLFGEEINVLAELQPYSKGFYETAMVDFEDIDELYSYCKTASWANIEDDRKYNNILFQWIAALAVYPKIQWELTLAIGKAIMDKYSRGSDLNFTTLLRIARIKWMADGQFPNYTRLELLKRLSRENEIIARETILAVLREIPETDLTNDHFAYEEKETQRLINEFNLYAYDPVKYAPYKRSKDLVGEMWRNKQMTDSPAKTYIENEDLEWKTLINKPPEPGEQKLPATNIPVNDYFGNAPAASGGLSKIYLLATRIFAVLFLLSLTGLAALAVLNFSSNKNISPFTKQEPYNAAIVFHYTDTTGYKAPEQVVLNIDTLNSTLVNYKPDTVLVPVDDAVKHVSVSVNDNTPFDTTMKIASDAYNITIFRNNEIEPVKPSDTTDQNKVAVLPASLHEIWQGKTLTNQLVNIDLRKKLIYYSTGDVNTYGTYPISLVTLTKTGAYKIVSFVSGGAKVFFIRTVTPTTFQLSVCPQLATDTTTVKQMDESYCNNFHRMELYYDYNIVSNIYLPVIALNGQARSLQINEANKIGNILNTRYNPKEYKIVAALSSNSRFLSAYKTTDILKYVVKARLTIDIKDISAGVITATNANPFQRSFLTLSYKAIGTMQGNLNGIDSALSNTPNTSQYSNQANQSAQKAGDILWLDENPGEEKAVEGELEKMHLTVDLAEKNESALNYLSKNNYGLIVIKNISKTAKFENGIELLKKLSPIIPKNNVVIYISRNDVQTYSKEISSLGFYQVVTTSTELMNAIKKHIGGKAKS